MRKYVLIILFGALGAVLRYLFKNIDLSLWISGLPLNTLIINVSGSFAFSLIITFAYKTGRLHPDLRLGITAGFLGAFTTFSTICREIAGFVSEGAYMQAFIYIVLSLLLGLGGAFAGAWVIKLIIIGKYRKLRKSLQSAKGMGAVK